MSDTEKKPDGPKPVRSRLPRSEGGLTSRAADIIIDQITMEQLIEETTAPDTPYTAAYALMVSTEQEHEKQIADLEANKAEVKRMRTESSERLVDIQARISKAEEAGEGTKTLEREERELRRADQQLIKELPKIRDIEAQISAAKEELRLISVSARTRLEVLEEDQRSVARELIRSYLDQDGDFYAAKYDNPRENAEEAISKGFDHVMEILGISDSEVQPLLLSLMKRIEDETPSAVEQAKEELAEEKRVKKAARKRPTIDEEEKEIAEGLAAEDARHAEEARLDAQMRNVSESTVELIVGSFSADIREKINAEIAASAPGGPGGVDFDAIEEAAANAVRELVYHKRRGTNLAQQIENLSTDPTSPEGELRLAIEEQMASIASSFGDSLEPDQAKELAGEIMSDIREAVKDMRDIPMPSPTGRTR